MNSKITKRPQLTATSITKPMQNTQVEKFIGGAPDAVEINQTNKGLMRGKRVQISHTMPPDMLNKVDNLAQEKGLTRAGLINIAIAEYMKQG